MYQRTYSRTKADGTKETWPETVERVATGNLGLVYGPRDTWPIEVEFEHDDLVSYLLDFKILPAGRHLWASGVQGRQYLFNCHVSGFEKSIEEHVEFTFLRLMEGGGVGANYSSKYLAPFGAPRRSLNVHIVCDPAHPDYQEMKDAGLLSAQFDADWAGSFEVEDSREGWSAALVDLIGTYMTDDEVRHDNRVYDVSRVRGKGARLKTFGGTASGPGPFARMMNEVGGVMNGAFTRVAISDQVRVMKYVGTPMSGLTPVEMMEIDHAIAVCVVSGGNRRSARMAMVHWRDPYIYDFMACKADGMKHWTTNISVEIDEEFIAALDDDTHAHHDRAVCVHGLAVQGMLSNGEPGYWNSSLSNEGEPNPVICTNPCGEIALEAWENCNLGHVNLDAFAPKEKDGSVDYVGLHRAHQLVTRFLIRATYGDVNDPKQAEKLARNRRIGVGHFGVQGFFAKQGVKYSEVPKHWEAGELLAELAVTVENECTEYAHRLRIPVPVKSRTVAPTGSIAKLPGATEGIHPIYARYFERRVRFSIADPDQANQVIELWSQGHHYETDSYDPSGNTLIVIFPTMEKLVDEVLALGYNADVVESADEISVHDMLAFQEMYQLYWADNAVSFTVNVPAEPHQQEEMLAGAFRISPPTPERQAEVSTTLKRFLPNLKGTTMMLDGARVQAPYTRITEAEYEAAGIGGVSDGIDENCANGACPVR